MDGSLAVLDKAVGECLSVSLWARSPEELVDWLDRVQVVVRRVGYAGAFPPRELGRLRWCQAHHATHWIDRATTDQDNGVLLCGYHHRLIHHSDWHVAIVDHHPEFTPPEYIDPDRKPVKGGQRRRQ